MRSAGYLPDDGLLKSCILESALLTPAELAQCEQLQSQCHAQGLQLSLFQALSHHYGDRQELWPRLFQTYWRQQSLPDLWESGVVPYVPWQPQAPVDPQIPVNLAPQVQVPLEFTRMGLDCHVLEWLLLRAQCSWEEVRPHLQFQPVNKPPAPTLSYPAGEPLAKVDLGALALYNQLIYHEELEEARLMIEQFRDSLPLQLVQIFHDRYLLDTELLCALHQCHLQMRYDLEMTQLQRRRLTPQAQRLMMARKIPMQRLSQDEIKQAQTLQWLLEEEFGLKLALTEIWVARGSLTDEILAGWDLPAPTSPEPKARSVHWGHRSKSALGELAMANGIITPRELARGLLIQERVRQLHGLEFKIGEILLALDLLDVPTLKALLVVQGYLRARQRLRVDLIQFSPPENQAILTTLQGRQALTPQVLGAALSIQQKLREHQLYWSLAKILLVKGIVRRRDIADLLTARAGLHTPATPRTTEQICQCKYLRKAQREVSLEVESSDQPPAESLVGQLALASGYLYQEDLQQAYRIQQYCRKRWNFSPSLAYLFLRKGHLELTQLNQLQHCANMLYSATAWATTLLIMQSPRRPTLSTEQCSALAPDITAARALQANLNAAGLAFELEQVLLCQGLLPPWYLRQVQQQTTADMDLAKLLLSELLPSKPTIAASQQWRQWQPRFLAGLLLGQIAREEGYLDNAQLEEVLTIQKMLRELGYGLKIGQIMVLLQKISVSQLQALLTHQQKQKLSLVWPEHPPPQGEDARLAEFITAQGLLPKSELERAFYIQDQLQAIGIVHNLHRVLQHMQVCSPATMAVIERELLTLRQDSSGDLEEDALSANLATTLEKLLREAESTPQPQPSARQSLPLLVSTKRAAPAPEPSPATASEIWPGFLLEEPEQTVPTDKEWTTFLLGEQDSPAESTNDGLTSKPSFPASWNIRATGKSQHE